LCLVTDITSSPVVTPIDDHGMKDGEDELRYRMVRLEAYDKGDRMIGDNTLPLRRIPVILDTDIGDDIDDTWALALLLRSPELDVKLVTTATGDTTYRAQIVARLLEVAGRTDVPVGIGPAGPLRTPPRQTAWIEGYSGLCSYREIKDKMMACTMPVFSHAYCSLPYHIGGVSRDCEHTNDEY
jgi:hypothetical protein